MHSSVVKTDRIFATFLLLLVFFTVVVVSVALNCRRKFPLLFTGPLSFYCYVALLSLLLFALRFVSIWFVSFCCFGTSLFVIFSIWLYFACITRTIIMNWYLYIQFIRNIKLQDDFIRSLIADRKIYLTVDMGEVIESGAQKKGRQRKWDMLKKISTKISKHFALQSRIIYSLLQNRDLLEKKKGMKMIFLVNSKLIFKFRIIEYNYSSSFLNKYLLAERFSPIKLYEVIIHDHWIHIERLLKINKCFTSIVGPVITFLFKYFITTAFDNWKLEGKSRSNRSNSIR